MGALDFIGGFVNPIGAVQGAWNLYKDIANVDMNRQTDASEYLMGVQHNYNTAAMDLQNQYALNMLGQQNNYNVQNMQRQFDYNSQMQDKTFDFNREMQNNQFQMNAMLNDQGRAVAQSRGAGINPTGASSAQGSVSAPSASVPSTGLPSASAPSVSALGASATVPHATTYLADILGSIEAGLKLDTYRDEVRKRKAQTKKEESEAKISETEAKNRQAWLDTLMQNGTTEAEAHMLATQIDAGYKRAMIDVNNRLADIKERGVRIEEQKVDVVVRDILADIEVKRQQARLIGSEWDISRKEYNNYEEKLAKALGVQEELAGVYHQTARMTEKSASWYETQMILNGILGAAGVFKRSK